METIKTIAERLKEKKGENIYRLAAKKCNTTYNYVIKIAAGKRSASKKKGKEVKEYLEELLNKDLATNK